MCVYTKMDLINPNHFKDNFSNFIVDNGIAGTAAGVSIAIATKDLITSFVGDILIPGIYLFLIHINAKAANVMLSSKSTLNYTKFAQNFITWIFIVLITFLFIQYFFNNVLGVNNKPTAAKKEPFSM